MRTIQSFDPSATVSGQITTQTVNPCSVVVLFNHSLNGLALAFPDGSTAILPPWYFRYYYLSMPGNVQWTKSFALTSTGPPVSLVTGEVYEPSEAQNRTFTEGPLPLQTNVGNTVNTNAGGSNSVQNDANTAQTFIEATLSGSPGSNIIIKNDGTIQSLEWIAGILTQIFKTDPGAASVVKLGNTGLLTEALGGLTVDQVLTAIGNTSLTTLATSGLATLNSLAVTNAASVGGPLTSANNQPHQFKDSGGTARTVLTVDGSNNTQLWGIPGLDLIQLLSSGGVLALVADLIHKSLDIKTTAVNVVGTTNGNATLYEFLTGTNVKAFCLFFNAYRNASGVSQIITLPVAFTAWAQWLAGNAAFITPRNGGSNLSNACRVLTTLASGGGASTATSLLPPKSLGEIIQGFDSFDLGNTQGSNNSSLYFFIGQ